jgi:hypothetical protein
MHTRKRKTSFRTPAETKRSRLSVMRNSKPSERNMLVSG